AEAFDRPDEAEDAYRRAVLAAPGSAHAGVGLLEVMVRRKDAAGELAALEGLAAAPGEIGAALGERAGWLALASGEVDRAGELFERARAHRPGALFGRALVEARGGDRLAHGDALAELGEALEVSS